MPFLPRFPRSKAKSGKFRGIWDFALILGKIASTQCSDATRLHVGAVTKMFDDEGKKIFFQELHKHWIEPELSNRRATGSLPENFMIYRCLIKLPHDNPPIVEFNDEIGWLTKPELAPGISMEEGQVILLHEIRGVKEVLPPEINGKRVAFIYLFWNGRSYNSVFDFTPNTPDELVGEIADQEFSLGTVIAEDIQAIFTEKAIHLYDNIQTELQNIGLWAVPSLLPYPITKIIKAVNDGDNDSARTVLIDFCTSEFLNNISSKWLNVVEFKVREKLIKDALHAHLEGRYGLSIFALLPQIEGIVTDWVYTQIPPEQVPWRPESKTKKFRDLVFDKASKTYTDRRILESTFEFVLNGPVLETFDNWLKVVDIAFPNRHAALHGRYEEMSYNEENSIKVFLLLDTIYHIIISLRVV